MSVNFNIKSSMEKLYEYLNALSIAGKLKISLQAMISIHNDRHDKLPKEWNKYIKGQDNDLILIHTTWIKYISEIYNRFGGLKIEEYLEVISLSRKITEELNKQVPSQK